MKKIILLGLLAITLFGCSKDKSNVDSDCGVVITLDKRRTDGGIQETVGLVACGANWHSFDGVNMQGAALLFNRGANRPAATYLVAMKTDTVYIRYESGNVPKTTVDSFTNIGYITKIATLTGLEHVKW